MATIIVEASQPTETIGTEIFHSLWGQERNPVPTAVDHAYERIWLQVIMGERQSGERLSDVELAAQIGISRTPVRQALHRLAQDELVHFDPRRGFWVRKFTARDINELYSVRGALEVLAVRLAVPHLRTEELETRLAELSAVRARLPEHPVALFLQHDFQLHNLWIRASRNGRLLRMLAALRSQVSLFQIRDTGYPWRMETALNDHERILHALIQDQTDQAADALADHIDSSKDGVLADIFDVERGVDRRQEVQR